MIIFGISMFPVFLGHGTFLTTTSLPVILALTTYNNNARAAANSTPTNNSVTTDKSSIDNSILMSNSDAMFPVSRTVTRRFNGTGPNITMAINMSNANNNFEGFYTNRASVDNTSHPVARRRVSLYTRTNVRCIRLPVTFSNLSIIIGPSGRFTRYLAASRLHTV